MLALSKTSAIDVVKMKLKATYLLNCTDIALTYVLLGTGEFLEANPFMNTIIQDPLKVFLAKIIFSALLVFYICKRIEGANEKQLKISNYLVNIILTMYLFINLSHVFWLTFLLIHN